MRNCMAFYGICAQSLSLCPPLFSVLQQSPETPRKETMHAWADDHAQRSENMNMHTGVWRINMQSWWSKLSYCICVCCSLASSMSCPWKSLSAELVKWLHQLMEEEHSETCCNFVEDFLQRAALPLLYYAKKAKNEIKAIKAEEGEEGKVTEVTDEAMEQAMSAQRALLCIRLLAQQLQSMAQSEQSEASESRGAKMTPEIEDLALALAHWVSTEWCSPRIEVAVAWRSLCQLPLESWTFQVVISSLHFSFFSNSFACIFWDTTHAWHNWGLLALLPGREVMFPFVQKLWPFEVEGRLGYRAAGAPKRETKIRKRRSGRRSGRHMKSWRTLPMKSVAKEPSSQNTAMTCNPVKSRNRYWCRWCLEGLTVWGLLRCQMVRTGIVHRPYTTCDKPVSEGMSWYVLPLQTAIDRGWRFCRSCMKLLEPLHEEVQQAPAKSKWNGIPFRRNHSTFVLRAISKAILRVDSTCTVWQEIGRQRLLHHGPWHCFNPVPGGWHTSYPAGAVSYRFVSHSGHCIQTSPNRTCQTNISRLQPVRR